jgi:5-methyltetrahydrofolate--homocysteine methyltransferase
MLRELIEERGWLLADGATGTNYFDAGLEAGDAPEFWNIDAPEKVKTLHRGFAEAGADIILTNSFGGNAYRLKLHGAEGRVRELNAEAARVARAVTQEFSRQILVAGSMGPTGELFEPVGTLTHEEGVEAFAEQAEGLKEGGADLLWLETMSAEEEVRAAIEGASRVGLPIVVTMSFDTAGRTMMGVTPQGFGQLAATLDPQPEAIGANCGVGAAELVATVLGISEARPDAIVVAKGNCGIPQFVDGHIHYSGTPELMADYARLARDAGARIIGGCCGTTAEHLSAMRQALESHEPGERPVIQTIIGKLGDVSNLAKGDIVATQGRSIRRRRRSQ